MGKESFSEVVVLPGTPCARTDSQAIRSSRWLHLKLALRRLVFSILEHKKTGQISKSTLLNAIV